HSPRTGTGLRARAGPGTPVGSCTGRQAGPEAAVYHKCRSGDERGFLARKENGSARHFLGTADSPERVQLARCRACRRRIRLGLKISFGEARIDVTGTDTVHADAFFAVIDGHGFGQADDGRL